MRITSTPTDKPTIMLIGYWPLLNPEDFGLDPGQGINDADFFERISARLDEDYPSGRAQACLWALDGDVPSPVLVLDRGREIAAHLEQWAEGKPEEWFKVCIEWTDVGYAVALVPDPARSKRRSQLARAIYQEDLTDMQYQIMSQPLVVVSGMSRTFRDIRDKLPPAGSRIYVGILDRADLAEDPSQTDLGKVIGWSFVREDRANCFEFCRQLIREV